MNEISLEKDILIISNQTIIKLFSYKNGADAVALYMFYHKQCKLQSSNQSFSTSVFVKTGLGWGDKRFKDAKNILKQLNLVEDIYTKNEKGQIVGWYIKLNFIRSLTTANLSSGAETHPVASSTPGYQNTNALSKKLEMLKVNKPNNYSVADDELIVNDKLNINADKIPIVNDNYITPQPKETISVKEDNLKEELIVNENNNPAEPPHKLADKIYDYYNIKFPKKKKARATAVDRIKQALKRYSYSELILFIDIYLKDKKETISKGEWGYVKTCENFFGNERGSKVKFIDNFVGRENELENNKEKEITEIKTEDLNWDI